MDALKERDKLTLPLTCLAVSKYGRNKSFHLRNYAKLATLTAPDHKSFVNRQILMLVLR